MSGMSTAVQVSTVFTAFVTSASLSHGQGPVESPKRAGQGFAPFPPCETFFEGAVFEGGTDFLRSLSVDLDGDGDLDLAVVDREPQPNPGSIHVFENRGDGSFAAATEYEVGIEPLAFEAGDLNGDGALDLVTTNQYSASVSVLLNDGFGGFAPHVDYDCPGTALLRLADLNADGSLDLVTTLARFPKVSVLMNRGDGTFDPRVDYDMQGTNTRAAIQWMILADVDSDGDPDLVITEERQDCIYANCWDVPGVVSTLLNAGDGTFGSYADYRIGILPRTVISTDLDGDGALDLVIACDSVTDPHSGPGPGSVFVLLNVGDGNFWPAVHYVAGYGVQTLVAADLDDDGDQDIAVANYGFGADGRGVFLMSNQGDGSFATWMYDVGVEGLRSIQSADLDLDGDEDLITIRDDSRGEYEVLVLRNPGNGSFSSHEDYSVDSWLGSLSLADLDQDGFPDLQTVTSNQLRVLTSRGNGRFGGRSYPAGASPASVTSADLDGDGDVDLAVANSTSDTVSVLLQGNRGGFRRRVEYAVGDRPEFVVSADLDGDGKNDLVVSNSLSDTVSVLRSDGDGTFEAGISYPVGREPAGLASADLDADGDLDLVVANWRSKTVSVLVNEGDGTFGQRSDIAVGTRPGRVAARDLDGDGDLDLCVTNAGSDSVSILLNQVDGTFSTETQYGAGVGPTSVAIADFDRDGDLDLAVTNPNSSKVSVIDNLGNGIFSLSGQYEVALGPNEVSIADLDGDADPDLVFFDRGAYSLSVLVNQGHGTFEEPLQYPVEFGVSGLTVADLDDDGDRDAVIVSRYGTVQVLRNRCR